MIIYIYSKDDGNQISDKKDKKDQVLEEKKPE
jgi:hypothetical protein